MHRVLGQRAVVDLERGARLRQRLQRHVRAAGRRVVQHRVAMAEGAALDVLAGEPDAACRRSRIDASASSSAAAQSIVRSSAASSMRTRFSRRALELRWIVKSGGSVSSDAFSSRSRSSGTAVFAFAAAPGGGALGLAARRDPAPGCSAS